MLENDNKISLLVWVQIIIVSGVLLLLYCAIVGRDAVDLLLKKASKAYGQAIEPLERRGIIKKGSLD